MGHSHGGAAQAPEQAPEKEVNVTSPVEAFTNDFGDAPDDDGCPIKNCAPLLVPEKSENRPGCEAAAAVINLYFRCEDLRMHHDKEPTTFIVAYSKLLREEAWTELCKTDIVSAKTWPNFGQEVQVPFCFEVTRYLRFEVYRVKAAEDKNDLSRQVFIGGTEIRTVDPVSARSVVEGWLTKDLLSPKDVPMGRLAIWAEENSAAKSTVCFDMSAVKLHYTDMWKFTADPYFVIHRTQKVSFDEEMHHSKTWNHAKLLETEDPKLDQAVMRSEVCRRRVSPKWKRVEELSAQDMCNGIGCQPIVIEVWDWFRTCKPRLIGMAVTDYDAMHNSFWKNTVLSMDLVKIKKGKHNKKEATRVLVPAGELVMQRVAVERRFSFLDYIRGGAIITPILAVDMTRGNLERKKHGRSLHAMDGDHLNDYAKTIKALYQVLEGYQGPDATKAYPIYGFGAKIPPAKARASHCFSLTGDCLLPFAMGIDGLLDAYHDSLRISTLHGPTRLREVVQVAADWARPYAQAEALDDEPGPNKLEQRYFVLIIITKGCVGDEQATLNAMVEATGLPLSIVVIGVGEEDQAFLETLNDEVKASQQLNLQVSCRMGHECHQVTQSTIHQTHQDCSECGCNVATCKTRWDCGVCSFVICENCSIWIAQKMANCPVQRNMVHFTKFSNFKRKPCALASEALSKVQGDFVSYYKALDVQPRCLGKCETPQGLPVIRERIDAPSAKAKAKAKTVAQEELSMMAAPSLRAVSKTASEASGKWSSAVSAVSAVLSLRSTASHRSSQTAGTVDEEAKEPEVDLTKLAPAFLKERRQVMVEEARRLGYTTYSIECALNDGVAEDSVECLVENIVHAGTGRANMDICCYKDAMARARPPKPKQADSEQTSRATSRVTSKDPSQFRRGSRLSLMRNSITADDTGTASPTGTRSLSPTSTAPHSRSVSRSIGGTKETNGSFGQHSQSLGRSAKSTKDNASRSVGGTKEIVLQLEGGAEEHIGRSAGGTKESLGGRRSSLKGTKESLRIAASSKELAYDDPRSPTFSLPGEIFAEEAVCTICLEQPINVELLPCRHRVACQQCMSKAGSLCPLCRTFITGHLEI